MGKSRAKLLEEDQIKVGFSDVAGVEEAKEDVICIVLLIGRLHSSHHAKKYTTNHYEHSNSY
jgi:hypothetical protein